MEKIIFTSSDIIVILVLNALRYSQYFECTILLDFVFLYAEQYNNFHLFCDSILHEMNLKQKILEECLKAVDKKLKTCEEGLKMIQESLASETKSTAGDKHETGRAMIQLEREQLGQQWAKIEAEKTILLKINPESKNEIAGLGSWVGTCDMNYFIATSIGKLTIDGTDCFVISPESPIGKLLAGKRKGEVFLFREKSVEILEIL